MGERRKCGDGSGGIECDYDEARAGAMMRWSRSDSSKIKEAHHGEDSTVTCVRASTTKVVKSGLHIPPELLLHRAAPMALHHCVWMNTMRSGVAIQV